VFGGWEMRRRGEEQGGYWWKTTMNDTLNIVDLMFDIFPQPFSCPACSVYIKK